MSPKAKWECANCGRKVRIDDRWCPTCKNTIYRPLFGDEREETVQERSKANEQGVEQRSGLARELAAMLNRRSRENLSGTPDHVLANYMLDCLEAYESAIRRREEFDDR